MMATATVEFTEGRTTRLVYHDTVVVTLTPKYITLNTGGWNTRTTVARMNGASLRHELGFHAFRKGGEVFVKRGGKVYSFTNNKLVLSR